MHRTLPIAALALAALAPPLDAQDSVAVPRRDSGVVHAGTIPAAADGAALLALARKARLAQDDALQAYDATARERFTAAVGIRDVGRERTVWRNESAARVRWSRAQGVHLDMLGRRRFAAGIAPAGGPAGDDYAPVPWYPGRDPLWIGGSTFVKPDVDESEAIHPFANGAEKYYTYARGDSIRIRLADGATIPLVELRVAPRTPQWKVAVGSFWLDGRDGQLVRAAFRYAAPIEIWQEARADTNPENRPPRWVTWLVSPLRGEITGVTIEHGLYEGRFWLPRRRVAEGRITAMTSRVAIKAEQRFDYDHVNGRLDVPPRFPEGRMAVRRHFDSLEVADSTRRAALRVALAGARTRSDSTALRRAETAWRDSSYKRWSARADSTRTAECAATGSYTRTSSRYGDRLPIQVVVPCDSVKLAQAPVFGGTEILSEDDRTWGSKEREELAASLTMARQAIWAPQRPTLHGFTTEFLRYNRVEGLSAGVALRQQLGAGLDWEASARLGTADLEPNAELALRRAAGTSVLRLAAYRRLVQSDDWGAAFTFGASMQNLLSALDEQFYHRAGGIELTGQRERFARGGVTWRLFAEHQWGAAAGTDWALGRLWNGGARFSRNIVDTIPAQAGTVAGAAARWRGIAGDDASPWRLAGDLRLEAAAGSFAYGRTALDATLERRLPGRLRLVAAGAVGLSAGELPPQRWWNLGGWQTVRGMTAGSRRGDSFWLTRGELWWQRKGFFQPAAFVDAGWAGPRDRFLDGARPIRSAGAGVAILNGLFRFDFARGLDAGGRWRFEGYAVARFP